MHPDILPEIHGRRWRDADLALLVTRGPDLILSNIEEPQAAYLACVDASINERERTGHFGVIGLFDVARVRPAAPRAPLWTQAQRCSPSDRSR